MKNSLILFGLAVFISGCKVSNYSGNYYFPENSIFDEANFKYVTTIYGSSTADWNFFGFNKNFIPEGLAASAKLDMYKLHNFKPNQIITNISVEMINSYISFFALFPIGGYSSTAVVSADIYEFSNNGDYFTDVNKLNPSIAPLNNSLVAEVNIHDDKINLKTVEPIFREGDNVSIKTINGPVVINGKLLKIAFNRVEIASKGQVFEFSYNIIEYIKLEQ